jgi:hypothetical protein
MSIAGDEGVFLFCFDTTRHGRGQTLGELNLKGEDRCVDTMAMGADDEAVTTMTMITGPAAVPSMPAW